MPALNLIQAVNFALRQEMARDDRMVVLGEDVGRLGGVFKATEGLLEEFGGNRVMDTPLNESGIIGVAIGMALYGMKPVAEIQFLDFIYPAFDQIVNELAKYRYRSGGEYSTPVVVRAPFGGGVKGGHYHSQSTEAFFVHTPGLQVVVPSTPYDAGGLLRSAVRGEDPVIFLEPKLIYRSFKEEVPDEDYTVPIGKAKVVREGKDVSIFTYGAATRQAMEACRLASEAGISPELMDLRTLLPLDIEAVLSSVRKTGRVVIVHEATKTGGFGAELAALISEKAVESLEAPVIRVCGFDTPFPYALEKLYLPNPKRIFRAIAKAMSY